MIGAATHPQEAMLKTAAFEAVFEFPLHVTWQYRVLGLQAVSQTPGLDPGFRVNSLSDRAYMPEKMQTGSLRSLQISLRRRQGKKC